MCGLSFLSLASLVLFALWCSWAIAWAGSGSAAYDALVLQDHTFMHITTW